jgi:hypothetical protein
LRESAFHSLRFNSQRSGAPEGWRIKSGVFVGFSLNCLSSSLRNSSPANFPLIFGSNTIPSFECLVQGSSLRCTHLVRHDITVLLPAQPPLFRPDYPKPWTHIELTPTNERIGGLEIEIEGLLRQLNPEFKPTSYLDFKRTSSRAPATFTAPVGGIKSCSGDSESTSTGSTSRSGSSVYSNTQPSGVSGSSSSSGKEKEGDGSTGDDPKENNTPGSVPNGSVKDEELKCPLRYKKGRKNIPDGCNKTFETEALAM